MCQQCELCGVKISHPATTHLYFYLVWKNVAVFFFNAEIILCTLRYEFETQIKSHIIDNSRQG
jgi:hypothetical protein